MPEENCGSEMDSEQRVFLLSRSGSYIRMYSPTGSPSYREVRTTRRRRSTSSRGVGAQVAPSLKFEDTRLRNSSQSGKLGAGSTRQRGAELDHQRTASGADMRWSSATGGTTEHSCRWWTRSSWLPSAWERPPTTFGISTIQTSQRDRPGRAAGSAGTGGHAAAGDTVHRRPPLLDRSPGLDALDFRLLR